MSSLARFIPGRSRDQPDQHQQHQREQRRSNIHANNAVNQQPQAMSPDFINEMTGHQLHQGTVDILSNMLSKDFVLGYFQDAEVWEFRWLLRLRIKLVEVLHPPQRSYVQGKRREFLLDDQTGRQGLEPLDDAQKAVMDSLVDGVVSRITRGREGWQQEMFGKTISESIVRDANDEGDGGGWFSLGRGT